MTLMALKRVCRPPHSRIVESSRLCLPHPSAHISVLSRMALPSLILITLVVATGAILLAAADPPQLCDAAGQPDDLVKKLCQLRTAANQLSNDITAVLIETELAEAETLESPDKRKNEFMRFGKRKNEFMRFGKRKNEFMRFGKRDEDTLKELEAVEH